MSSQGPFNPTIGSSIENGGDDWSDGGNIFASDDSYATVALSSTTSDYLYAGGFNDLDISSTATVDGIQFDVERQRDGTSADIEDAEFFATKDGLATAGTDQSAGATWPDNDTYATFGGDGNLFGTTWTPAEINDPDFGCFLSCLSAGSETAKVDHVRCTVYFTFTPTKLGVFSPQPANTVEDQPIDNFNVTVEDANNNICDEATNEITIAIGTNPSSGTLSGENANNAITGVASFVGLSIDNPGTGYTLTASAAGLTGSTSDAFDITDDGSGGGFRGMLLLGVGG